MTCGRSKVVAMSESRDIQVHVGEFVDGVRSFEGFQRRVLTVGELRADSNWPWGYAFGVYSFIRAGEVVYVGRAIGKTLGQRLANQLASLDDPGWAAVVRDQETVVELYEVGHDHLALAAALEVHLIQTLRPQFNSRIA
jgi:hypothetical protein